MSQSNRCLSKPCTRRVLPGLALLLVIAALPVRAESLHAVWHGESHSALVDQMLTTLAEDVRSNRLFLSTGAEQLRSFLLQRLCLDASAGCMDHPDIISAASLGLTPAEIDLLLQHLNASLQSTQLPLHQQQRLLQQLSQQAVPASASRPLASL